MKFFHLIRIAASLSLLALVGCGTAAAPAPSAADAAPQPLLTVTTRGGMCPNNACSTTTEVATDGTYRVTLGTGESTSGKLDAAQTTALAQQVEQANFDELSARPFTGTCPIAFDGQELVYTFHTNAGNRVLESCKVEIDPSSPLFQAVDQALAATQ